MSVLDVSCRLAPVKHCHWRVDPAAKFSTLDSVDKVDAVAGGLSTRREFGELRDELIRENVISIEREHPWCRDVRFFQAILPLIAVTIERFLKDTHAWK